jgi:hypothetical protein
MAVSWQTGRKSVGKRDAAPDDASGAEDSMDSEETWMTVPGALTDTDERRAVMRDLVLRALI